MVRIRVRVRIRVGVRVMVIVRVRDMVRIRVRVRVRVRIRVMPPATGPLLGCSIASRVAYQVPTEQASDRVRISLPAHSQPARRTRTGV